MANLTLYVRLEDEAQKDELKDLADVLDLSINEVVVRLVKYLLAHDADNRQAILEKKRPETTIEKISRFLVKFAWADHAFSNKSWATAIEEYRELKDSSVEGDDMWLLSQYKEAFCFIDLAVGARDEALLRAHDHERDRPTDPEHWAECYRRADQALRYAIVYNNDFLSHVDRDRLPASCPVVIFNLVCCWSLRAQYAAEFSLGPAHGPLIEAYSPPAGGDPIGELEWTKDLGEGWRHEIEKDDVRKALVPVVVGFRRRAVEELRHLAKAVTQESAFLLDLIRTDPDLGFLRWDLDANRDSELVLRSCDISYSAAALTSSLASAADKNVQDKAQQLELLLQGLEFDG